MDFFKEVGTFFDKSQRTVMTDPEKRVGLEISTEKH
jgi:hypothetical protein